MSSPWQRYKEKNGVTPLSLLNPKTRTVDDNFANQRLDICKLCPEFFSITGQCKKCGCFMSVKTKLESAKCPLGKW